MASSRQPRRNIWRRIPKGVWGLGLVSMFMDISSEMIHALLPLFLVSVFGAPATVVGIIEGIAEASAAITKLFSGAISDWLGKRKMLAVIGYGLAAFTKPVFPLGNSIAILFAARFVDRIGKGIRGAPRDALVADLTPPFLRGAAYGLRQSLDTIGAVLGPALALLLMWLAAGHFRTVFWFAVIPAFVSVAILIWMVREPERPVAEGRVRWPLAPGQMRLLGGAYWLVTAVATLFTLARFSEAFLVLRWQSVGLAIETAPLTLVLMNVAYALSAYPVGVLADRVNKLNLLIAGLGVFVLADLILAAGDGFFGFSLGVILWGLHMGLTQGLLASIVADTVPVRLRGTGFGVFNMLSGVALLVASVIAGVLWDTAGPQWTFITSAAIAVLAMFGLGLVRLVFPHIGATRPEEVA